MKPENKKTSKKSYSSPKFLLYGEIREITRATGTKAKPDSGRKVVKHE